MIKISQAVIVEGKYDKIKLSSIIDAVIIETGGYAIYKNPEKLGLIRALAKKTGILILTDSDRAGFQIRSYLKGAIPDGQVLHAYIPDVLGKERRKDVPSKEGKLGVEGIDTRSLLAALAQAGVAVDKRPAGARITKLDLYNDGLAGGKDSVLLRRRLLKELNLPERLSANALVDVLNAFYTPEQYHGLIKRLCDEAPPHPEPKEGRNR